MALCCTCNGRNAVCKRCICVHNNRHCVSCLPSRSGKCSNQAAVSESDGRESQNTRGVPSDSLRPPDQNWQCGLPFVFPIRGINCWRRYLMLPGSWQRTFDFCSRFCCQQEWPRVLVTPFLFCSVLLWVSAKKEKGYPLLLSSITKLGMKLLNLGREMILSPLLPLLLLLGWNVRLELRRILWRNWRVMYCASLVRVTPPCWLFEWDFCFPSTKHPAPYPDLVIEPLDAEPEFKGELSDLEVAYAVKSFHTGQREGLRTWLVESGCFLLRALVSFVDFVLSGAVKQSVCPLFCGANLITFNKKEGGLRPIAVGNTLRRLVAKCAGLLVRNEMSELLVPFQLGYGVKGGAEAAVHGACLFHREL